MPWIGVRYRANGNRPQLYRGLRVFFDSELAHRIFGGDLDVMGRFV